jgi:hypothetical protein
LILDLGIADCPRALLVKYEDLSTDPPGHFPRVFRFVDQPLKARYLRGIHRGAGRRDPFPVIPRDVVETCSALHAEIDRRYRLSLARHDDTREPGR